MTMILELTKGTMLNRFRVEVMVKLGDLRGDPILML
jgi:hypothetical protein